MNKKKLKKQMEKHLHEQMLMQQKMMHNIRVQKWLDASCAGFGYTGAQARRLWIASKSGRPWAQIEVHRIQCNFPKYKEVWVYFAQQTLEHRRAQGKKNPPDFGSYERKPSNSWDRIRQTSSRGLNTIRSGGLPSLGKGSR